MSWMCRYCNTPLVVDPCTLASVLPPWSVLSLSPCASFLFLVGGWGRCTRSDFHHWALWVTVLHKFISGAFMDCLTFCIAAYVHMDTNYVIECICILIHMYVCAPTSQTWTLLGFKWTCSLAKWRCTHGIIHCLHIHYTPTSTHVRTYPLCVVLCPVSLRVYVMHIKFMQALYY